jgi:NADH-quinone oxidoreductase subunit B
VVGAAVERRWVQVGSQRVSLHVVELGLACCGIEVREARRAAEVLGAVSDPGAGGGSEAPVDVHVLVVAGTVTARLAPHLVEVFTALPEPRAVLAFGACAATGGPYWDSYSVLPGAAEVVPVDVWVPGCPPRPQDLVAGLAEVLRARS